MAVRGSPPRRIVLLVAVYFEPAARISELTGAGEEAAMTMETSTGNRGRIGRRIAALRGE